MHMVSHFWEDVETLFQHAKAICEASNPSILEMAQMRANINNVFRSIDEHTSRSSVEACTYRNMMREVFYDRLVNVMRVGISDKVVLHLLNEPMAACSVAKAGRVDLATVLKTSGTTVITDRAMELMKIAAFNDRVDMFNWLVINAMTARSVSLDTLRTFACVSVEGHAQNMLDMLLTKKLTHRAKSTRRKSVSWSCYNDPNALMHMWTDVANAAASVGNIHALVRLRHHSNAIINSKIALTIARSGNVAALGWIMDTDPDIVNMPSIIYTSVIYNHIDLFDWAFEHASKHDERIRNYLQCECMDLLVTAVRYSHGDLAVRIARAFNIHPTRPIISELINAGLYMTFKNNGIV